MNAKNFFILFLLISAKALSQTPKNLIWATDGHAYYSLWNGKIIVEAPGKITGSRKVIAEALIPSGEIGPIEIKSFTLSPKQNLAIIFAVKTVILSVLNVCNITAMEKM